MGIGTRRVRRSMGSISDVMPPRTLVIVNPQSRNGATRSIFLRLEDRLRTRLGSIEVDWTKAARDAERIAREGVQAGVERILVAGGDGTVSEVISGILAAGLGEAVEVGVLPLGTGADFVRGLGMARRVDRAIEEVAAGRVRLVDAGRVVYRDREGEERISYFVNSATFGVSGLVCEMVNHTSKRLGGTVSFLTGTLRALARFRPTRVELRLDGQLIYTGGIALATASNGPYFGGGMRATPRARLDDGLLDVMIVPGLPKGELIRRLPRIYLGTHVGVAGVEYHQGRELEAIPLLGTTRLEVDGEPLGVLPARFNVLPRALRVVGGPPA